MLKNKPRVKTHQHRCTALCFSTATSCHLHLPLATTHPCTDGMTAACFDGKKPGYSSLLNTNYIHKKEKAHPTTLEQRHCSSADAYQTLKIEFWYRRGHMEAYHIRLIGDTGI